MALALRHNKDSKHAGSSNGNGLAIRRSRESDVERWQPFSEFEQLRRDLDRFAEFWRRGSAMTEGFTPLADVEETDDAYVVEIELAGVQRADIDIEVSGQRLTVRGERKEKERVGILRRRDRVVGTFTYEITLPGKLDEDEVRADLIDGVLTVHLPKPESERPRRIMIS